MSTLRVYKDFMRRALVAFAYVRETGNTFSSVSANLRENLLRHQEFTIRNTKEDLDLNTSLLKSLQFLDGYDNWNAPGVELNELIKQSAAQLASKDVNHDRDLIDSIVRVLQSPYARNVLGGSNLQQLRQAILVPDELSTLKQGLKEDRFCANCTHKFVNAEMCTFVLDGANSPIYICTRCAKPSSMAADNDPTKTVRIEKVKGLLGIFGRKIMAEPDANDAVGAVDEILAAPQAPAVDILGQHLRQRARREAEAARPRGARAFDAQVGRPVVVAAGPADPQYYYGNGIVDYGPQVPPVGPPVVPVADDQMQADVAQRREIIEQAMRGMAGNGPNNG